MIEHSQVTVSPISASTRWLWRWHALTGLYVEFLTLLLWLSNPKVLLFGLEPSDDASGYAHLITFTLLGFMVELGRRRKSVATWFGILVFYGLFTEYVQHFLPIRGFELRDLGQDVIGILLGMGIAWIAKKAGRKLLPNFFAKNTTGFNRPPLHRLEQ